MRKHYHVLTGLQGCCLPDSNDLATSKRGARSIARERAKLWNDCETDGRTDYMVQKAPGVYVSRHQWIHVSGPCTDDCDGEY